jgi:hypothetical protein
LKQKRAYDFALYQERNHMDLAQNNLIRFINITKKKDGIFANFKAKGIRGGAVFSASISVDISAAEVHPADPLEKIIEECARIAVLQFRNTDLQFEGLVAL